MKNNPLNNFDFFLKDLFVKTFKDEIYLVGGTIRDLLLYNKIIEHRDIDLVVTNHKYDDIEKKLKKFGKTNTVGKNFAVVKFTKDGETFDISIPRKETKREKSSHSHKNFIIECGPHISLEEDLSRRDFTCNSIALRLSDNTLIDPFQGQKAIKEMKIIMTGPETFSDDPLRILRAARFASVHKFQIDQRIYENAKDIELKELSIERITEELFRLLLESEQPARGLNEYWKLSILTKLIPQLDALTLTLQDSLFHPETDEFGHHNVWAHTLITVDVAKSLSQAFSLSEEQTLTLLLSALFHDIGKSVTTKWEHKNGRMTITSLFHDARGAEITEKILAEFKIETRNNFPVKKTILNLIKNHHRIYDLYRNREIISFKAIARLVRDLEEQDLLLLLLDVADRRARMENPLAYQQQDEVISWYNQQKEAYNINKETIKPLIMGKDLIKEGIQPGLKMGQYLKKLYDLQLDGEFSTRDEGLKIFRNFKMNTDD